MINRIRELLEVRQLSPTQFADLIGVGRPVISHILSERNKPSLEVVQKVLDAFPDISLSWLMKGIGPMLTNAGPVPAAPLASVDAAPPVPQAPFEAVHVQPVAPLPPPAPTITPSPSPQPQAFVTYNPTPVATAQPATATPPPPRPVPHKFRPGAAKASSLPANTAAATLLPTELAAIAPVIAPQVAGPLPVAPVPAPAASIAAPLAATKPIAPVVLDSYEQTRTVDYQPAAQQPVPPGLSQGFVVPAVVSTPPVAEPPMPNPAAALSFLGEPGKAIRRIVIFYRDGSFSDFVPEGK